MERQKFLGMSAQGASLAAYTADEAKVVASHKVSRAVQKHSHPPR